MKKSQSAIEAAVLIGFMSFALILVLFASYQKLGEAQAGNDQRALEDVLTVIESELSLASSANNGYYREFELPPLVNGRDYNVTFIGKGVTGANFTEVEVKLLNASLVQNAVTPDNIFGSICKGKNLIIKTAGMVNITCNQCSNTVDDDLDGCSDYPDDTGCISPSQGAEASGPCRTECSDSSDNDGNGCSDFPADTGCTAADDISESGGTCQCSDGTPFGSCDGGGGFCDEGIIVPGCGPPTNCGCGIGFSCQGNVCVPDSLGCSAGPACAFVDIMHLSENTNAHAEVPSLSDYPLKICCASPEPISSSCINPDAKIVSLSSTTDAHAEKAGQTEYPVDICISSAENTINCGYVSAAGNGFSACSAAGYDTCAVTISADTDAHLADCITDPYDIKVCCKTTYDADTLDGLHWSTGVAYPGAGYGIKEYADASFT